MTERTKKEIYPTLKISVSKSDENGVVFKKDCQCILRDIKDLDTVHGKKTIATVEIGDDKFDVFVNNVSMNNLIDEFGSQDSQWLGKICNLVKQTDAKYNKEMIVFIPVA